MEGENSGSGGGPSLEEPGAQPVEGASEEETGSQSVEDADGPAASKPGGELKPHYAKQKSQQFTYFRVNGGDSAKFSSGQFTLYDFITNSFAFSPSKRDMAVAVLEEVRVEPKSFQQLLEKLGAKKSSLYLLCLSLERSGLIEREGGKRAPYRLSSSFGDALASYASWWQRYRGQE